MRLIDLSHEIENGMTTFEGQPAPVIEQYSARGATYDAAFRFEKNTLAPPTNKITMVECTGTMIDAPSYISADLPDISELQLSAIAGLEAIVVRHSYNEKGRMISSDVFDGLDLTGKAVLFNTGWSTHWRSFRYFKGWPYLSEEGAESLAKARVAIVGIDSLNIDITDDGRRPVHKVLHEANIPIVSHMTGLEQVPTEGATFFAAPLKVRGCKSFSVRAFCTLK